MEAEAGGGGEGGGRDGGGEGAGRWGRRRWRRHARWWRLVDPTVEVEMAVPAQARGGNDGVPLRRARGGATVAAMVIAAAGAVRREAGLGAYLAVGTVAGRQERRT